MTPATKYLDSLNKNYFKIHKSYEDVFWISYMGDHSVDAKMKKLLIERDAFRSNSKYTEEIKRLIPQSSQEEKTRLESWLRFFSFYQTPKEALSIKKKIDALEARIAKKRATRKEGYIDSVTKKFVEASSNKMGSMIGTNPDEKIRKACFDAKQKMATGLLTEYVQLIGLRNQYAQKLGYTDFYDFKVRREDGMTKAELFSIFGSIYEKTKYAKDNVAKLGKKNPELILPWNFGYMMAGDFTKEEDPFYQFDDALDRWGQSFARMGVDFKGGKLTLDLLDRKGKYNNGFCHWPDVVRYEGERRLPGSSNFTCNVVFGQIGSGSQGFDTLFHEGGHAAHLLNSTEKDVCVNHEYAPMSTSWSETQSMFMDTVLGSIEWASRYAINKNGEKYPFDLFERQIRKLHLLTPLGLNGIILVSNFEKEIYESKNLTKDKVIEIAKKNHKKYSSTSSEVLSVLNTPHIYSWESSASYHGYGLATLALTQWREYFFKKYGYIVDNPKIGEEMQNVWKLAGSKTFNDFVVMATGKKLSADSYIKSATASIPKILKMAKEKIARLEKVKVSNKPVDLKAEIRMVHGKKEISNNKKSFEDMAKKYGKWVKTQRVK